jgi:hypothetical protein
MNWFVPASPIQIQSIAVATNALLSVDETRFTSIAFSFGGSDMQDDPPSIHQVHPPFDFELSGCFQPSVLANECCDFGTRFQRQIRDDEKDSAPRAIHGSAAGFAHTVICMGLRLRRQDTQ